MIKVRRWGVRRTILGSFQDGMLLIAIGHTSESSFLWGFAHLTPNQTQLSNSIQIPKLTSLSYSQIHGIKCDFILNIPPEYICKYNFMKFSWREKAPQAICSLAE